MIGFFDSGLGGLSVWHTFVTHYPSISTIYIADQAHCPYGERDEDWIRQRAQTLTERLLAKGCTSIVIACNTATSAAAHALRLAYPHVHIIGMEPAIKPACHATNTGHIAVLATQATLNGQRYQRLVAQYSDCIITPIIGHGLVDLVEHHQAHLSSSRDHLARVLQPIAASLDTDQPIDQLVLGCTHYPFLAPAITQLYPQLRLHNPAHAVALQAYRQHHAPQEALSVHQLWTTAAHATTLQQFYDTLALKHPRITIGTLHEA